MRRNALPMERINRSLLMLPEDLTRALVEEREGGKTPSRPAPVSPHAPHPLNGIEGVSTASREAMQPQPRLPVGQRRRQRGCTVDATPVDAPHHLLPALAPRAPWLDG